MYGRLRNMFLATALLVSTAAAPVAAQCYPPGYLIYNKMKNRNTETCEKSFFFAKWKVAADDPNQVSEKEFNDELAALNLNWGSTGAPHFVESFHAKSECSGQETKYQRAGDFLKSADFLGALSLMDVPASIYTLTPDITAAVSSGDFGFAPGAHIVFRLGGAFSNWWVDLVGKDAKFFDCTTQKWTTTNPKK